LLQGPILTLLLVGILRAWSPLLLSCCSINEIRCRSCTPSTT
jgi:hypothetical protein